MDLSGTGFIGSNSNGVGKFTAGLPRDFSCRGTLKEEGSSHLPLVWLKLNPTTRLRSIFHYLNTLRNLGSDEIKRPVVQTHPHPTRRVFQTSGDILTYIPMLYVNINIMGIYYDILTYQWGYLPSDFPSAIHTTNRGNSGNSGDRIRCRFVACPITGWTFYGYVRQLNPIEVHETSWNIMKHHETPWNISMKHLHETSPLSNH